MIGLDRVRNYLKKFNIEDRIIVHDNETDTIENAAKEIGCTEEEICKTMAFMVEETPIVICMSGKSKIDNSKYKSEFHKKAKMVPFSEVTDIIGHLPGGVCPFGVKSNVKVYLDDSLKEFDIVYAAAGTPVSTIGLTIEELEKYSEYIKYIDVTKKED